MTKRMLKQSLHVFHATSNWKRLTFPLFNRHILVKTTASEQQSRQALNGKVDKIPKLSLTDCVTDEHKNQPTSAPSRSHLMQ